MHQSRFNMMRKYIGISRWVPCRGMPWDAMPWDAVEKIHEFSHNGDDDDDNDDDDNNDDNNDDNDNNNNNNNGARRENPRIFSKIRGFSLRMYAQTHATYVNSPYIYP